MSETTYPVLEFDPNPQAILQPHHWKLDSLPESGVLCFFNEVLTTLAAEGRLTVLGHLISEIGANPVYLLEHRGRKLFVAHPGVGAPLSAGFMEELIASGGKNFIAVGGGGVLDGQHAPGVPFIVTHAVRDEGTSYHYLPPSREAVANPRGVLALQRAFEREGVACRPGKTWTTDAIYRETAGKRERRMAEGCEIVEMEAAAFIAVAEFRKVNFGQVVYAGDLVVPEGWDRRGWNDRRDIRERLFWLSADAALELEDITRSDAE